MRRRVIYSLVGVVAGLLLAAIAIPNFARSRFHSSETLAFKLRAVDQKGSPIQGAEAKILWPRAVTGADGYCEFAIAFPASGTFGSSGKCKLSGTLRVTAPGFSVWERDLKTVFGASYDYFHNGTQLTHVVILVK